MLLDSFAQQVASIQIWSGQSKTQAIKTAIENHLKGALVANGATLSDLETFDQYISKSESLKTSVFRAIGKGGESYDLYCAVLAKERFNFIFG